MQLSYGKLLYRVKKDAKNQNSFIMQLSYGKLLYRAKKDAKKMKILAVNPGSTSTKIALFEDETKLFSATVDHNADTLKAFKEINDQLPYRKAEILKRLAAENISLDRLDAVSGRCGGTPGQTCGTYEINEKLMDDIVSGRYVKHMANLGGQLAKSIADEYGAKAYIVNPPETDELSDVARVTGLKGVYRLSRVHALNQKEIALRFAASQHRRYEEMNLIVAHIGGGLSVTAHEKGRMVDTTDIVNGDGPMATTRSGSIPCMDIIKLCFSGDYTQKQLIDRINKFGGLVDHLGTSDVREILRMIDGGDEYARLIYDAMIYETGKYIGAMASVLHGRVDAILLTGGIANDGYLVEKLSDMCGYIAPVRAMPGEFEMEALACGAYRALSGQEQAKTYTGEPVWHGFGALARGEHS